MKTAFAYARVSTKDQAKKENSIPAQFKRIEKYASDNKIKILKRFFDTDSAYHDEKRTEFQKMIDEALEEYPNFIITDDSSRFARRKEVAVEVKSKLRKNGINIVYSNEPYIDPKTIAGLWNEGIQELMNETSSMKTAFHVRKGMEHNIQNRDKEKEWCYKNGGSAAYGYKNVHLVRGSDTKGKPILKSIWEIDEEKAKIIRYVIVDLYINKKMSYAEIRDELNKKCIKTSRGKTWATASVVELLTEHRLKTYSGYAIWNKTDTETKGRKYKDKEEWIEVENAHPSIITKEELESALERKKYNRQGAPKGKTRKSSFLFTGNNFELKPIFICEKCGGSFVGYQQQKSNYYKYTCGTHRFKGSIACDNDIKIDRDWLESSILEEISNKFTSKDRINEIVEKVKDNVNLKNSSIDDDINNIKVRLNKYDLEIERLVAGLKEGLPASIIKDELNNINNEKQRLEEEYQQLKKDYSNDSDINIKKLKEFLNNFRQIYNNSDIMKKRELVRTFVRQIKYNSDTNELKVEFYQDGIVQTLGKGEPYHK